MRLGDLELIMVPIGRNNTYFLPPEHLEAAESAYQEERSSHPHIASEVLRAIIYTRFSFLNILAVSPTELHCLKNRFTGDLSFGDEYAKEAAMAVRRMRGWVDSGLVIEVF